MTSTTPPIRRITDERIVLTSMEFVRRERSNSSSTSSSTTTINSLRSFSSNHSLDDESENEQWNSSQVLSTIPSRQIITPSPEIVPLDLNPCEICLEERSITRSSCCSSLICSECLDKHLSSHITEGRIRILCPSCSHIYTREEILLFLSGNCSNEELSERYKRYYADINGEAHMKTCPRCCAIKEIDKKLFQSIHWKENLPRKVLCDYCQFQWCFFCHSPWHDKITCKQFQQGEKMLQLWATQINENQQNAQKCPRCKVYISRNGGCPHMICSKCQCDFCYNCGRRRIGIKYLGSHESRYSPFGCKFNLYPNQPILRHTVRGLVAGAATLAAPVAAVGAVALLAVGTTIGGPTYGTYRLVKHIKSKREQRRRRDQFEIFSKQWTNRQNSHQEGLTDINHYHRAVQASLMTFKQENQRREQIHLEDNDDDDDDDSIDE